MLSVPVNMGRAVDCASLIREVAAKAGFNAAEIGMACLLVSGLLAARKVPEPGEALKDWLEQMSMAVHAVCNPEETKQ